ncbi:CRS1 / YhbY (CRM) domain-containing protein [Klebsormidium nitens]|uniref:CRS1 / YhbY (CRM) domain-containing protein n=1 Tax=Klebsormidium nitens TaxID=105231 RepID=A0A1Y1HTJ2_KLENI|nr:CRS1 / YhbY (CRM) domain-containing protein [Klebsormidium nitens]|eukprot:GAQ81940.1 CRS1 / YhbY (CRM) domain-containing protein [Klebsormidium nitens]
MFAADGSGGRYNAPGARSGSFAPDSRAQVERTSGWQANSGDDGVSDYVSDDDGGVQTRSFERGRPRVPKGGIPPGLPGGPPEEPGVPFRRTLLKKELFEKQGKQLAGNLGLDERDLYGWKANDLRNSDALDEGKRPEFRDFSQRDIFRDRIRTAPEPRPPPQNRFSSEDRPSKTGPKTPWVRNGVSSPPSERRFQSDSSPFDSRPGSPQFRNRVSAPPNSRQGGRGASGRMAPSDFQNQAVTPFQKPKPPGLDVGPTIDSIKPRFVPREDPPDTNHLGWKPENNRGYRPPRETRYNAAVESPPVYRPPQEPNFDRGEDLPQGGAPQQWLRRPPAPPVSRFRPVARDGEIQFEEEKGGKQRPSGLEQEDDGFWDEEHGGEEISFARAALSHDLEVEDLEEAQYRMQEEERAEKLRRRRAMYRAEMILEEAELKRLRRNAIRQRWFLKIGKTGVTNTVLDEIYKVWENLEVAKLKVREDALHGQMRALHNTLEEKTGGLVILRTGTLIHLYRGPDYKGPPPRSKINDITEAIGDQDLFGESDDLEEGDLMTQFEVEDGITSVAPILLRDHTEDVPQFARKVALMSGGEKGGVRKRLTEKPVRWLPPGQTAKLTNFEMMMLRRKGKRIKPAFVLGQQRRFDGLAAAIMEYWERNEIVKISCRAVINANLERTAKAIQDLIGGVLLVKEGGLISIYRGKDYLPLRIGEALRRYQQRMIAEKAAEREQESAALEISDGETVPMEAPSATWVAEAGVSEREFEEELAEDEKVAREELKVAGEVESLEVPGGSEGVASVLDAVESGSDAEKAEVSDGVRASVSGTSSEGVSPLLEKVLSAEEGLVSSSGRSESEAASGANETVKRLRALLDATSGESAADSATGESVDNEEENDADAVSDGTGADADAAKLISDAASSVLDAAIQDSDGAFLDSDATSADSDGVNKPAPKLVKDLVVLDDEVPQARIDQMLEAVAAYRRRDVETLTPEERAALRKKGLGERRFLQVGRRGVFSGTIQNIHLHWKRHELCKVKCTGIRPEIVPIVAEQLAVESGGVLVDYVGTTILLYRGKNYIAPETIVPVHMLNKQEALRRAKAEQRAQSLLDLEIQRQEELAKQRKRLEYSLKLEQAAEAPKKKKQEYPLAPGVREYVVIPEAVELNTTVEMELRKQGPLIPKEHNQPDLPAFWRAPDMSPLQKQKIARMSKQERTNAFLVGKRGITEGLGLTIRQHFYKHAFAKVSLKQRPNGITVKECMIELERLTGGVCVSKEPTRVIIYRGWEPGTDPPWIKKDPETGAVLLPRRPLIAQVLREAEEAEMDDQSEEKSDAENGEDWKTQGTNVYGERDDFTMGTDADWEGEEGPGGDDDFGGGFDEDEVPPVLGEEDDDESEGGRSGGADKGAALPPMLFVDTNGVAHSSLEPAP